MDIVASAPARGNSGPGPFAPRPEATPGHTAGPGQPVGYEFDPIPSAVRRDPRLKPVDHLVLAILISFAVWRRDSCWTTVPIIARRIAAIRPGRSGEPNASDRTVQRSLGRLKAAGYLRHERVPKPDPDQPGNKTGWRFYFTFAPLQPHPDAPAREVTKAGREVTKGEATPPAPPPSPGGEVTKESPDSIVTQDRGEVWEPEPRTLNVAALAGPGDGEAGGGLPSLTSCDTGEAGADAGQGLPSLTPCDTAVATNSPDASGEPPVAAAPTPEAPAPAPSEAEVETWLGWLRSPQRFRQAIALAGLPEDRVPPEWRGRWLDQRERGSAAEVPRRPAPAPAPPSPTPVAPAPPAAGRPAPKVATAARAAVVAAIGRLTSPGPSNPDVREAARLMIEATGPHENPGLTEATFVGLAGAVRSGSLPQACLQEAFEEACGRKVRERGAAFVAAVRRWKKARAGGRPPA